MAYAGANTQEGKGEQMTNLEWKRSLSVEEVGNAILWSRCNLCVYQNSDACPRNPTNKEGHYDCMSGFKEWCNAEHITELKPCPVCKGEMSTIWKHCGYYLVCKECGLRFGLSTDMAKRGLIAGHYAKKEALIEDWNRRIDDGRHE